MKLCIFRLSAIGDVCHANALVLALRQRYPEAEITWIVGRVEYQLLQYMPDIEFIVFDKSQGLRAYKELKEQLKERHFDYLLHMQISLRANVASLMISAKNKIGFDKLRAKEGHSFVINRTIESQVQPHVIDGFFGFYKQISSESFDLQHIHWDFFLPSNVFDSVKQWLQPSNKYFAICPCASKKERNWSNDGYAKVAKYAQEQGFKVLIFGGPSALEQTKAKEIMEKVGGSSSIINLVGQTNLPTLLALLNQVDLVLAPDTGPLHMAVTQKTPVIGLYAHSNPRRTGPYLYRDLIVSVYDQHIEKQHGCSFEQLPWGVRAKGADLMKNISVDDVLAKFQLAQTKYLA